MDKEELNKTKKIMLSGGGSGGPVTPLLEIAREMKKSKPDLNFVFVGTENGPERKMLEDFGGIPFVSLPAGKLRRYFSLKNFLDIFNIISAFFQSFSLLKKERPDIIISAGSFCSVPLVYAAIFFRIPILIHQQDVRAGLANRIMSPWAKVITAVFEKTLADYGPKAILTGNPISIPCDDEAYDEVLSPFFSADLPLLLIVGGGTGATAINDLVEKAKDDLLNFCYVIHLTGKDKNQKNNFAEKISSEMTEVNKMPAKGQYLSLEFLSHKRLMAVMKKSSLVISRCGLGVLTEISALAKASILIPMPGSHQEDNAQIFAKTKAALVLDQRQINHNIFIKEIKRLLEDRELLSSYGQNASNLMEKGAAEKISAIVWEIIK